MKTAIYIRTSTKEQNPKNQLKDCESIINYREYILFEDKQSAWKEDKERKEFELLKQKIKNKEIDNLIVWDLDRIYRNRKRLIEFFELCKFYKCKIHSFRQKWLEELNRIQQPFNEIMYNLMLQIMGWLAEEESNKKSMRTKSAIRKKDGITISYKGNKWGRKEFSKQTINKIIELRKQGKSIRAITKEVTIYDKNNNEKKISKSAVHKLLSKYYPLKDSLSKVL